MQVFADEARSPRALALGGSPQAGVIFPDSDREWIRESLGLPEAEEGAVSPEWQLERSLNGQESALTGNQHGEMS